MNLPTKKNQSSALSGFHKLSLAGRRQVLTERSDLTSEEIDILMSGGLSTHQADLLTENAIGVLGLPLGLATNFLIDDSEYLLPMAVEEASVIAAVSRAAKIIRRGGGLKSEVDEPIMIGQVQVLDLKDPRVAVKLLHRPESKKEILALANNAIPNMVARGGGAKDLQARLVGRDAGKEMLIVHLFVDVREAMGANVVNTVCEAVAPKIGEIVGGQTNLRILSNLADRRLAKASFRVAVSALPNFDYSVEEIARRIVEASNLAKADSYRAATHNKGIFNGIDAVAIALGQDWRAIEAGGHAYAARHGQYRALTDYRLEKKYLIGEIELPMQVGWYGRVAKIHPTIQVLRKLTGITSAGELAGVLAAVGLAQNFAAILALVTEGIQKGHMPLCEKVKQR